MAWLLAGRRLSHINQVRSPQLYELPSQSGRPLLRLQQLQWTEGRGPSALSATCKKLPSAKAQNRSRGPVSAFKSGPPSQSPLLSLDEKITCQLNVGRPPTSSMALSLVLRVVPAFLFVVVIGARISIGGGTVADGGRWSRLAVRRRGRVIGVMVMGRATKGTPPWGCVWNWNLNSDKGWTSSFFGLRLGRPSASAVVSHR
ncbi:hypothetical protein BC827DRAFT_1155101 [Russula dissimulans]|nr:hypothetical protein BC827DRAFT_1155101 [Russula dissimulans]